MKDTSWKDDVKNQIDKFKPDLLAMSCTEDMWELGVDILRKLNTTRISLIPQ